MQTNDRDLATEYAEKTKATTERIAQWCEWFDLTPPKLKIRKGSVYLTDELYEWIMESGASFDWIFVGDAKCMASAFRDREVETLALQRKLEQLDEAERKIILSALTAQQAGEITFDEALAQMQANVEAHRRDPAPDAA